MKLPGLFLQIVFLFFAQSIFAQQNGSLFLSAETLKKYPDSYEVDQYVHEHYFSGRFSNSGWKYHPGDDFKWKEAAYSDSNWTILKTDFYLDSIPRNEWQGIGWFRLKLIIDSSLYNQVLAVIMTHYGASEIYLDGKLINQYGIPSKDPSIEKTLRPLFKQPVMLPLDDKPVHLLAVRYSFQNANTLFDKYGRVLWSVNEQNGFAGFLLHFRNSKEAIEIYGSSLNKNLLIAIITLSALLMIGSFHFFLYAFYSKDSFNLYMSVFNFVLAAQSLTKFLPTYTHLGLQSIILDNSFNILFGSLWLPVTMLAYYSLFYTKFPRHVWLYFIMTPLLGYEWTFNHAFGDKIAFWLTLIVFLDMLRLFIRSVLKKEKYIWIIGVGVLVSQSGLVLYFTPFNSTPASNIFLMYTLFLAVPFTLSIFNAVRTAKTNLDLEKQLAEVNRLSKISLAQEQEKQQLLSSQKEMLEKQVTERTAELKQSLENLKSTQAQLIQSEKMASLGELTAGIAHEIQNPLNFVNNFSEVNTELIDEMQQELKAGNRDEAIVISNNIKDNEAKISDHGKRADAIVKGMLQHSRSSSGVKESTDISALADEYLRLAYHGSRAKNKSFNAILETDFDQTIEKINIVPQDIGRVLLNVINNAFYALAEKKKQLGEAFEPTVSVKTKKRDDKIEIRVKDNGNGIPQKVLDKVFQPFFTTKPTGQGTGLGLSLSYDIIKAHGGELKVETKEARPDDPAGQGVGAEFIILLPIV